MVGITRDNLERKAALLSWDNEEERFERWQNLKDLRTADDWRGAISVLEKSPPDPLLLWLRPTICWLHQLADILINNLSIDRVISIGCGSGLLEWLLSSATLESRSPLEVIGVEVNRSWWESSRSPPIFIPLIFPEESQNSDMVKKTLQDGKNCALMFCYFNDLNAFHGYVERYGGEVSVMVIAGPTPGGDVHCEPEPLHDVLGGQWKRITVVKLEETGGGSLAAVYAKR